MDDDNDGERVIVVSRVLMDGLLVVIDPPARFMPMQTPRGWTVAANEFLLRPRARSRAELPAAAQSALWNLGVVLRSLDDPHVQCNAPPDLLLRAATLCRRIRTVSAIALSDD